MSKTQEQKEQKEPEPTINDVYWLIKDIETKTRRGIRRGIKGEWVLVNRYIS